MGLAARLGGALTLIRVLTYEIPYKDVGILPTCAHEAQCAGDRSASESPTKRPLWGATPNFFGDGSIAYKGRVKTPQVAA